MRARVLLHFNSLKTKTEENPVRALQTLQAALQESYTKIHVRRVQAVWRGVEGLARGGRLWLTGLGRDLAGTTSDKHGIKAADRLLGNASLQAEVSTFYAGLAKLLLRAIRHPIILVDWTGVGPHHTALTAALCFMGRALPIYSRVYLNRNQYSRSKQRQFVKGLAKVLPVGCRPILVTDAGYHATWFKAVRKQGWDFVGRIRNSTHAKVNGHWVPVKSLHKRVTNRARNLGKLYLYKSHPVEYRFVLAKARKSKGRKRLTTRGTEGRRTDDYKYSKQAREPWLLATSLKCNPKAVVAIYALRMQIEESFRDLKNHRHGWALEDIGCKTSERIEVLLMLAALANVAMQTLGLAAESLKIHYEFQANTIRNRRVLSFFVLARMLLARGVEIPDGAQRRAFSTLRKIIAKNANLVS